MLTKSLIQKITYALAIAVSIFLLFFVITVSWIGYEVKHQCQLAKQQYSGDCVEAMMSQLSDEQQGFRTRNDAVWVLGQLGDSRALPLLQSMYTGNIPDREPLHQTISQYELRKAVDLTSGGTNIGAWLWRGFVGQE